MIYNFNIVCLNIKSQITYILTNIFLIASVPQTEATFKKLAGSKMKKHLSYSVSSRKFTIAKPLLSSPKLPNFFK